MFISRRIIAVAAAAFLALGLPSAQAAESAGKVMIVLDASGSMWGQIGGKAKIDIARATIEDLLKGWDPRIELGLSAYGHRKKGRCDDIETLIPVGKPDPKAIMKAVNGLKPKGKTPLSDAVRRAAEELKYTEEQATVILVSDGRETCKADPCAIGKALEDKGIDFTAHVIGFDVKKSEQTGLKCLAENTGGKFIAAKDAKGLKDALKTTVKEVQKAAEVKPKPKPKPVATEAGTKLVALYSEGGKEYAGQVNWRVFEPKKGLDGKREKVAEQHRGKSGHIFRDLKPGVYTIQAQLSDHGHITREFEIEVKAGEAAIHKLVFDIGTVRFDAKLSAASPAFKGQLGWQVFGTKKGLDGTRDRVGNFWRVNSGGIFILPAGKWTVEGVLADHKHVATAEEIAVEAGGEEAHEFVFNAGTVRFDAFLKQGSPAFKGQLGWTVLSAKKEGLEGKRKKIASFWRHNTGAIYILPAGTWRIEGVLADHKQVSLTGEITVKPGGEEAHAFVFNAGTVRIDVTRDGKPFGGQVGWELFDPKQDLAGNLRKVMGAWRVKSGHIAILPEGDYLVTGVEADNKKFKSKDTLSVKAGEEKVLTIDLRQP